MQSQFKRSASLLVTAFLIVQLFSPAVYAATPTPTATPAAPAAVTIPLPPVQDCTVYEISAADRDKLWANTMGFLPSEINDLSQQAAVANTKNNLVGTFQNPVTATAIPNAGFPAYATGAQGDAGNARINDVAGLLSVDPVEMVNYFCGADDDCKKLYLDPATGKVKPDAVISVVYAKAYADTKGAGKGDLVVNQLRSLGLLPGSGGIQLPTPTPIPYETMKIVLPGMEPGKNEYSLSELFRAQKVNPDKCVIDSVIQGKVSYSGVLNDDLTYGALNENVLSGERINPATDGKSSELERPINQHFTGSTLNGYLVLNGGANLLIPSFYEDWLAHVKKATDVQLAISVVGGVLSVSADKMLQNFIKSRSLMAEEAQKELTALGSVSRTFPANLNTEIDPKMFPASISSELTAKAAGGTKVTMKDLLSLKSAEVIKRSDAAAQVQDTLRPYIDTAKNVRALATPNAVAAMSMGMGWLGPARFIFSVNNGLLFSAKGERHDKYLSVLVNKDVAKRFKSATALFGGGPISEKIGQLTGGMSAPTEAFSSGPVFLINYPSPSEIDDAASGSVTVFQAVNGVYNIQTKWKGSSFSTNFEDLRSAEDAKFSRLPLMTNNLLPKVSVNQKASGEVYTWATRIGVPLMLFKGVAGEFGQVFAAAVLLKSVEVVMGVPDDYGKGAECSSKELGDIKKAYDAWLIWGNAFQLILSLSTGIGGGLGGATIAKAIAAKSLFVGGIFNKVITAVNPVAVAQLYWGDKAMEYVSNCKDPQYKILTYQALTEQKKKAAATDALTQKAAPLTDFLSQLNLGKAVAASSQSSGPDLSQMREILNLKVNMQSQFGWVAPSEITYVHIESSAFAVNSKLWDTLHGTGCKDYQENYQSGDKTARLTKEGLSFLDKQGNLKARFNSYEWSLRALGRLRSQEQARVIIPNKLIETKLDSSTCGSASFIEVDTKGAPKLTGLPASCDAADCLVKQLEKVTGRKVTTDLLPFLGKVSSIDTSEGIAAVSDGMIRFTRLRGGSSGSGLVGSETTAPSVTDLTKQDLNLDGSKLVVKGDGTVVLYGPTGGSAGADGAALGTLSTIIGDRGKIEYDASDGRLLFFAYILATEQKNDLNKIQARVVENELSDGSSVPAIKMDTGEKTGTDSTFRDALAAIQGDGGMQSWEDENHLVYVTKDPVTGEPILRVVDKKTGVATDYKITGDVTRNADGSITIPTDKGAFNFTFGKDTQGNPTLGVTGPDGLKEILALLAARGQNGIMTFNPSTGAISIYNGQDIPLSPEFAKNGISFTGDGNGNTVGTPQQNLFGQSRVGAAGSSGQTTSQPLTLPSWPSDVLMGSLMLVSVLGLVLVIRRRTTFSG